MAKYVVNGIHTRRVNGAIKIWYPGDEIAPTNFELVSFPNKFSIVSTEEETITVEPEKVVEEVEVVDASAEFVSLDILRDQLTSIVESDEYEESVVEEAKKFLKRNPKTQNSIDGLVAEIQTFLSELEDEPEDETEGAEAEVE